MNNESQRLLLEYDEIFGEKHHEICEGKKCECHKEVKALILKAYQQGVLDSLGKLPMKKPSLTTPSRKGIIGSRAINYDYNQAISESEASIKSLIE